MSSDTPRTREGADPNCVLWEWGTYEPTDRLNELRANKTPLTADDVTILFAMYLDGCEDSGPDTAPVLVDFGQWLAGSAPYEKPAEVIW